MFKGVFFPPAFFFFFFLKLRTSLHNLIPAASAGTALCKIWALNKRYWNKHTSMNYLPLFSTSPLSLSPALPTTPQPGLHQRVGRTSVHSVRMCCSTYSEITWSTKADINQDQTPIPNMICMEIKRHLCTTSLASIRHWHRPSTGAFDCCCFPNAKWLAIPEQSLH